MSLKGRMHREEKGVSCSQRAAMSEDMCTPSEKGRLKETRENALVSSNANF